MRRLAIAAGLVIILALALQHERTMRSALTVVQTERAEAQADAESYARQLRECEDKLDAR